MHTQDGTSFDWREGAVTLYAIRPRNYSATEACNYYQDRKKFTEKLTVTVEYEFLYGQMDKAEFSYEASEATCLPLKSK